MTFKTVIALCLAAAASTLPLTAVCDEQIEADLLVVGGSESACAAAVQAARMGVQRIVLVNDIGWLGGQFSSESVMAIDENTYKTGIRHDPPIPRHGAFKEVIERIEADNLKKYNVARPGNTRVITTCRPADAERVFREWLAAYTNSGQITIRSWYEPSEVVVRDNRVRSVLFEPRRRPGAKEDDREPLRVSARLTIDASDWGDVIRLSGATYEFGPDLKEKYGEPLAPPKREGYPLTDMNPITYCMVIVESEEKTPIPRPKGYNAENYRSHRYPKDPLWLYGSRRIIDHYHFKQIKHPDVLLLCFPAFDYPLDVHTRAVAEALESTQPGAATKNIVELSPAQRRIIFEDAKRYSLGFLHYLQTEVHEQMPDKTHSFRRFRLTNEFNTPDKLPPKPYARESLRMHAMYMMRQQDTTGVGGDSANYARAMYHDGVGVWQFEYDFHPTKREFLSKGDRTGPWRNAFREGRTWGPPYSGRSLLSLRSLIPRKLDGLLAAQKNVGFSSIVSSAVRLHDQSMTVGQASGACAAVALKQNLQPRQIPLNRQHLMAVQGGIAHRPDGGQPGMLWPFRDLPPSDPAFTAVNMLAIQQCLPLRGDEVEFKSQQRPEQSWMEQVVSRTRAQLQQPDQQLQPPTDAASRGEFANRWWKLVSGKTWKPYVRHSSTDADGDGIADVEDSLPLDDENASLPVPPPAPDKDGLPDELPKSLLVIKHVNFAGKGVASGEGITTDHGERFRPERSFGWSRDLSSSHRQRGKAKLLPDTYVFTRTHDVWECVAPNGHYVVDLSIGDSAHQQFGQNVTVEGEPVFRNISTMSGRFAEKRVRVEVKDGKLTVEIGMPGGQTNTCLNWVRISRTNE